MEKVKGIGGVFLKSQDSERLRRWYAEHLGLDTHAWGATFRWRDDDDPSRRRQTVLGLFKSDSDYFAPSTLDHMINFIVEDLDAIRRQLAESGVELGDIYEDDNGRFCWVQDPDGRRVELWQPAPEKAE